MQQKSSTILRGILMGLISLQFGTGAAISAELNWSSDLQEGIKKAGSQHKFVLADVYTDWCGWCKQLDKTTFQDSKMVDYLNGKFVCVKLNAEDHGQGTEAASQNHIEGYPTALVYDGTGKVVGKIVGYKDASGYEKALKDLVGN